MLKLGIIGTGSIAHQFMEASQLAHAFQLTAVYSRKQETAQQFIANYGEVACFTHLEAFAQADFDVIYIASPNSLHYEQALLAISFGKHLIIEKPAFSNPKEFAHIIEAAKEKQVLIFEASRNFHEKTLDVIKSFLSNKKIYGATLNFSQYSSRMKNLLQGQYDNVFQSKLSGGALVDLGIYEVYASYKLFGQPETARYVADLLPTGVDVSGSGQLIYPDFHVNFTVRKNAHSSLPSEIYTDKGTLVLNHIQGVSSAIFHNLIGEKITLPLTPAPHLMLEEIENFARIMEEKDLYQAEYEALLTTAQQVNKTLYQMRQDANIIFEADSHV